MPGFQWINFLSRILVLFQINLSSTSRKTKVLHYPQVMQPYESLHDFYHDQGDAIGNIPSWCAADKKISPVYKAYNNLIWDCHRNILKLHLNDCWYVIHRFLCYRPVQKFLHIISKLKWL